MSFGHSHCGSAAQPLRADAPGRPRSGTRCTAAASVRAAATGQTPGHAHACVLDQQARVHNSHTSVCVCLCVQCWESFSRGHVIEFTATEAYTVRMCCNQLLGKRLPPPPPGPVLLLPAAGAQGAASLLELNTAARCMVALCRL